jgi:hypothetical protein
MKKSTKASLTQKAMQALTNAVAKVVEDHRRQARPLAVWRDGKAIWISAAEAGSLHETPPRYRTKAHGPKS